MEGESLRLGLTPWLEEGDGGAEALTAQALRAEELGYHSFWLPESHFSGAGSQPAPLLRLAVVAARTRRLRIGTTSFLLPVRHPIHVAEEVAVLDRLSGGRLILGVGRGFRSSLFAAFDVPAREKRDRLEAALAVMRDAWLGKPLADAEAGSEPVQLAPRPLQRPHPPIWMAAFGPKGIEQAGRLGLPYLASPIETLAALEDNYARHRRALPESAAEGLPVPVMRTVFASNDLSLLARAHAALARQSRALARARGLGRLAGAEVDDWAIVGEPDQVARRIHELRQRLGITHLIVRGHLPELPPEALEESLELLAKLEIGPR